MVELRFKAGEQSFDWWLTCGRKVKQERRDLAKTLAERFGFEYLPRRERPLEELLQLSHERTVLVMEGEELYALTRGTRYAFHPNMARLRIANLRRGAPDKLIEALKLEPGGSVLDATMGLGGEAIVCSSVAGPTGHIVAIEQVPEIAFVNAWGLQTFVAQLPALNEAMPRVEVWCGNHLDWLPQVEKDAFEAVYFDPFFDRGLKGSEPLEPLRALAGEGGFRVEALTEARRVASRLVVVKFRKGSELADLPYDEIIGGKGSKVAYGVFTS